MIPHVAQLKFAHHAYLIDTAMTQAIIEKSPVKILVFRLLRINTCVERHFLQGIGNPACFDVVGAPGAAGVTEQTFPRQLVCQGIFNVTKDNHADQAVRGDHICIFSYRTSGSAALALITGGNILARTCHNFQGENIRRLGIVFKCFCSQT